MITPQPQAKKLANALGLTTGLYLKREDLHPHGSHKGRSIPVMIETYIKSGWANFCISSSGNAAISAAITINKYNLKNKNSKLGLKIFAGQNIDNKKLAVIKKLLNKKILLKQVANPKQSAFQMDKTNLAKNLRQSTDDTALIGYSSLAKELAKIKNLAAVFIPTSSGATAQALHKEFRKLFQRRVSTDVTRHDFVKSNPQINIVQTPACHPMVESSAPIGHSLAGAIVDKVGYRKEAVKKAMRDSGGKGWIAADKDIVEIKRLVKKTEGLDISPNSALGVAGLNLALQNNWKFNGPVVCLITGR